MGVKAIFDSQNWAAVPFHFWSIVFFVLGCIVGSFLNVVIHRLPLGQSIVSPPSHCPHCRYSIPWYLNIPLVTWLYLRGKCRNCGAPISVRYFAVELVTGIAFAGCWLTFGDQSAILALIFCVFLSGLIAGAMIDFEHFIIPDQITIGGMMVGFLLSIFFPQLHGQTTILGSIGASLLGIATGAGIFYALVRLGKWRFGKFNLDLDPASRLVFGETGLSLPAKRLSLKDHLARGRGGFAVHARLVELSDRCFWNVPVGISETKIIIGDKTFDRADVPHLEILVGRVASLSQTVRMFGGQPGPLDPIIAWVSSLWESFRNRGKAFIDFDSHIALADGELWLYREDIPFGDMFYRNTDTVILDAARVNASVGSWKNVPFRLTTHQLKIGDDTFNPEAVSNIEVITDAVTIPREAMGLGDVKLMAGVGAFLGWQATLFSLAISSFIGTAVGLTLIAVGRRPSRLAYVPYLSLAAIIWIFAPGLRLWWLENLRMFGQLFSGSPGPV
jgi:leader peptidase (prepilin peptidase) / N-methyltransferase